MMANCGRTEEERDGDVLVGGYRFPQVAQQDALLAEAASLARSMLSFFLQEIRNTSAL
jgi:hypothetical protein